MCFTRLTVSLLCTTIWIVEKGRSKAEHPHTRKIGRGEYMAVSDAKKKANAKWDSENMATLACKVKKDHADRFKAYCSEIGKTSNAVLRDCVLSCVDGESPQKPAGAAQGIDAILTPETFKAAQEAAQAAEETLSEFISRAVDTQAKRDKVMFAMRQKELTSAQAGV